MTTQSASVFEVIGGSKVGVWLKRVETLCIRRESLQRRRHSLGGNATSQRYPSIFNRIDEVAHAIERTMKGAIIPKSELERLQQRTADELRTWAAIDPNPSPFTDFLTRQGTLWAMLDRREHVGMNGSWYSDDGTVYQFSEPPADEHQRLYQQRGYWWKQFALWRGEYAMDFGNWREPEDQSQYGELPSTDAHGPVPDLLTRVNECAIVLGVIDSRMEELRPGEPHYRVTRRYAFRR